MILRECSVAIALGVFVVGFQKFVAMPEDQTVVVGGVAKFDCRYEPEDLLMKWFKGSILIKYAVRPERVRIGNGSLMILEVEKSDSETYTCQVADRRATASLTVKLSSDTSECILING